MAKIKKIKAREILDSRGNPTLEVKIQLSNEMVATAGVPSGASTGKFEALELRDNDQKRYLGKGVLKAVSNVNNKISSLLKNINIEDQEKIDDKMLELDGTDNKANLGANAIVGVSLATVRAAAYNANKFLWQYIQEKFNFKNNNKEVIPMFNILNGGAHSDSGLSIQEFKLIPQGIRSYTEQLRAGSEIFHTLKKILSNNNFRIAVGDEGGFAPRLESQEQALKLINQAIKEAGYQAGKEVFLGLDAAANYFYNQENNQYILKPENSILSKKSLINLYKEWQEKYNLISLEDGLEEEDWEGWNFMNQEIGDNLLLIGDDLLVTNPQRLQKAIKNKACNAALVKPNQIGTFSETIQYVKLAQSHNMKIIVSHRSGETVDSFIADLAVGIGADYIKTGSLSRGERLAKYNRLLEIFTKEKK